MAATGWPLVTLGDVLSRVKRPVKLQPSVSYRSIGIRWYGAGVFEKPAQPGSKIAAKTLYAVEPGDVMYSRLFGWKGSFGVAKAQHEGAVASNEFPTLSNRRNAPRVLRSLGFPAKCLVGCRGSTKLRDERQQPESAR